MFKYWVLIAAVFLAVSVKAQSLDLNEICGGAVKKPSIKMSKIDGEEYIIMDKGFCAEFMKEQELKRLPMHDLRKEITLLSKNEVMSGLNCEPATFVNNSSPAGLRLIEKDKWKIRFYASHSWTTYFNSNLKINSSRYQVEIKDYEWAERSSREFFEWSTMTAKGNNPAQIIDEPTNTFVISLEKNGFEFFLSAFHPKFLQAKDQVKHITGTVDGVYIDRTQEVNQRFVDYTNTPGETKIVDNRSSHKQMSFEIGAAKRFTLIKSKLGNIVYVPGIGVGVMVGETVTVAVKPGSWWDLEGATDKYGVQGFGGSFTNRLEFNTKNEKFGVFVENKVSMYKMNHGFLDGNQTYNLSYMGNSVGFKAMLWNPNNHKKKATKLEEQDAYDPKSK